MNLRDRFDEAFLRRLDARRLVARRRARGRAGEHRSARAGAGIEPASHRPYAPGDDFRRIDWSAYRRLERLYVLDRAEESERTVTLLVDRSASMGRQGKLEAAAALAAALAWVALSEGDAVEVGSFAGDDVRLRAPGRGHGAFFSILAALEELEAAGATRLESACRRARRGPTRAGLSVLVTDFLDPEPARRALLALAEGGRELALVHVVAPEDESPPEGVRRLVDVETGDELELVLDGPAREDYARAFSEWTRGLEAEARSLQGAYVRLRSDQPLELATLAVLERGGVLS